MSILLLGTPKCGKKTFTMMVSATTPALVFTEDASVATLVIIMSVVGCDPMPIFENIKDTISCPVIIVFNKHELEAEIKKNYMYLTTMSVNAAAYRIKLDKFLKRKASVFQKIRKYSLPIYYISCFEMTIDEISNILERMMAAPPTLPLFKCAEFV
jgi:hypothetical protein